MSTPSERAMKLCPHCNANLQGTHGKVRFCSPSCRDGYNNRSRQLGVHLAAVLNHTNCKNCGCPHLTKNSHAQACSPICRYAVQNASRPTGSTGYQGYIYSSKTVPAAKRILKIADRASPKQCGRLADWLLRRGHFSLKHYAVDEFVSDHNTQGI